MQNNNIFDIWVDPDRKEKWREEAEERGYDEKRFEAAGYYRGRVGETFVCTHQQFEEWDKEAYRQREADKFNSEYLANKSFRAGKIPKPEQDPQNEFDVKLSADLLKELNTNDKINNDPQKRSIIGDGSRQLGRKRLSKQRRSEKKMKYRDAA